MEELNPLLPNAPPVDPNPVNPALCCPPNPGPCWARFPKEGAFWLARLPKVGALEAEAKPNPPALAAAVPSPNTLLPVEPRGLEKVGADPNAGDPPKEGELPKAGGLPNTGAAPKPPAFTGLVKEPNPCVATLLAPVLKVPLGFSPNEELPNPFAPLFPNRLLAPG